jgi:hypothetical protein
VKIHAFAFEIKVALKKTVLVACCIFCSLASLLSRRQLQLHLDQLPNSTMTYLHLCARHNNNFELAVVYANCTLLGLIFLFDVDTFAFSKFTTICIDNLSV